MRQAGKALHAAGVGALYLIHGTFVGVDALGILADLGRIYPPCRNVLERVTKQLVDWVAADYGNYTPQYASRMAEAIAVEGRPPIPVRLFHWSSENHHLGRADGAVRLIGELSTLELPPGKRVLLWGHSHAGNLLALVSNLLSGDEESRGKFFEAGRWYYRWPLLGLLDIPIWQRVESQLSDASRRRRRYPLDVVTFGTPVRYGWDAGGYARLLHFINHRPAPGLPSHLAPFPPSFEDILRAKDGDYVQQIGIAGTNTMPNVVQWRAWTADQRLGRLVQKEVSSRDLLSHLQLGARVPDEGTTLLVDYGPPKGHLAQHLAGHAVYTQEDWMLFHTEEVVKRFYTAGRERTG